jgi:hypothetical protein
MPLQPFVEVSLGILGHSPQIRAQLGVYHRTILLVLRHPLSHHRGEMIDFEHEKISSSRESARIPMEGRFMAGALAHKYFFGQGKAEVLWRLLV